MLVIVIDDLDQTALFAADLLLAHPLDVIVKEIERLQGLHERRGGDIALRSAPPVPEGQSPSESCRQSGLAVLTGYKDQRLVEPDDLGAGQVEADQVVDDELLERLQEERRAPERRAVDSLALLMAQRLLDDPDAELRGIMVDLVGGVLQIPEEPLDGLMPFLIRDDLPVPDAFRVLQDLRPFLVLHAPPILLSASSSAEPFSFFRSPSSLIRLSPAGVSPRSRQ